MSNLINKYKFMINMAMANKGVVQANKGRAQANKSVGFVIWLGDFFYRFMIYPVLIFKDF